MPHKVTSILLLVVAITCNHVLCQNDDDDITQGPPAADKPWVPAWGYFDGSPTLWRDRHEAYVNQTILHRDEIQIFFFGDSKTEGWLGDGGEAWEKYFTSRSGFNYGIGGDSTRQILWRMDHKELDGVNPKVLVIMIGENNFWPGFNQATDDEIAQAIFLIMDQLRAKLPNTQLILLAQLPREPGTLARAQNLNRMLDEHYSQNPDERITFFNIYNYFLRPDGTQNTDLFVSDLIHISSIGYKLLATLLEPHIQKYVGSDYTEPDITQGPPAADKPWVPAWNFLDFWPTFYKERHESLLQQTISHRDEIQIFFLGDSKTEYWANEGKEPWDKYYTSRGGYNYGIGGDTTRHIIWRLDHHEADGVNPKVLIMMIGENNFQDNPSKATDEEIVEGIAAIVGTLRVRVPNTPIILLAQLPRESGTIARAQNINQLLGDHYSQYPDERIIFFNIYNYFLRPDGTQNTDLFVGDQVHISPDGYKLLATLLEPYIQKYVGSDYTEPDITQGPPAADKAWVPGWNFVDSSPTFYKDRHESLLQQTISHRDEIQIFFLGDSKTEGWLGDGGEAWQKYYASRGGYNYGIGGDTTRHIIWRLDHHEADGVNPKVLVLMIGENNFGDGPSKATDEEIVEGIAAIVGQLRIRLPNTQIILLPQLPRVSSTIARAENINRLLGDHYSQYPDERINFHNVYSAFLRPDGTQNLDLFVGDQVHISLDGYKLMATLLEPYIQKYISSRYVEGDITAGAPAADKPWVPGWSFYDTAPTFWRDRHETMVNQSIMYGDQVKIVFLGDSKTEHWLYEGIDTWNQYYSSRGGYNYGIGGDTTRQIIWRIDHQELDGIDPKVLVMMIGENNFWSANDDEITEGIVAINYQLRVRVPNAQIILLAQLPRESGSIDRATHLNQLLSDHYSQYPDKRITFVNFFDDFLRPDGTQNTDLFVDDQVHISSQGYALLANLLEPYIQQYLNV